MLGRRLVSTLLKTSQTSQFSSFPKSVGKGESKKLGRKAVQILLISLTGGVALSALDDLLIYHGCSSKAMEKASQNQEIVGALGEPIVRGPWYNASLALAHKRNSVSCTFPVSGPQGTGIFQLKAIRHGDDTWFPFLRPRDWDILIMEALLHVPASEEKHRTFRISLSDSIKPPSSSECTDCRSKELGSPENR